MKLKLPRGTTGFYNDRNEWVCTGSQMGRANRIPSGAIEQPVKMRLQRLPFVGGDYDRWGAYWGGPATVWISESADVVEFGDSLQTVQIFVRADCRTEARQKVTEMIPTARFYR